MSKLLIVIDVQNDFVSGVLGTSESQAIIPKAKEKIAEYYERGDKILFTRDSHDDRYLSTAEGKKLPIPHCIYGTEGWKIVSGLEVPGCRYIDKPTFGYPSWAYTLNKLDNPNEIEIIGLDTDICVVANALIIKTISPDTEITVDASCCAGSTTEKHKAALEVMKSCQINVVEGE